MAKFQVNILGCGSATPTARHQPSCQVVDFRDKLFMIDCGEGAQLMFRRLGLKFSRLNHIFISHLHGDHLFGLPGLLSTMALHQISGSVTVHIFRDGARLMKEWMDFFNRNSPFEIIYDIIEEGERRIVYEDSGLTIETFPLYHRTPCSGFIFREKPKQRHLRGDAVKFHNVPVSQIKNIKDGADYVKEDGTVIPNIMLTTDADPSMSYAYCSDTMMDKRVAKDIEGVDTVYHEATYDDSLEATARERGHSTARQAALIATAAGAKRLIIGHFSKRYNSEEILLKEASEEFQDVIVANEGLRVDLE
ncbi:ribonuclease Z [uncultured Duncaniella sp.]|uniref:ribonuclease Z n=1 Tax=uncultured Duncaniella sp. TaxID=2768039 RepID=UPI0025F8E9FC|nr:ribonuclease Z [uncultured Duncaniella sp.]